MSKSQLLQVLGDAAKNPAPQTNNPLEIRAWFNAAFSRGPAPEGVAIELLDVGDFKAEMLTPEGDVKPGLIIYFHGGGFVFGNLDTHRSIAAGLCEVSRRKVLHVDYRLAPEFTSPTAHEDAIGAYDWALSQNFSPAEIALCGDSAGGNLALSTAVAIRDAGRTVPKCLGLMSPALDIAGDGESHKTIEDPMLPPPLVDLFWQCYGGDIDRRSSKLTPFYGDLSNLPPTLFHVGSWEILRDDSLSAAEKMSAAGGWAEVKVWEDMCHSVQMFAPFVDEGRDSIAGMGQFFDTHLSSN